MYLSTIWGFFLVFAALVLALADEGGSIFSMVSGPAAKIVFLGALGAALVSSTAGAVFALPALLWKALVPSPYRPAKAKEWVKTCLHLAERARDSGLASLSAEPPASDPFLRRGIVLLVAGTDRKAVAEILEADIAGMERRHEERYGLVSASGRVFLGLGWIGLLIGTIQTLGNLEDTSKLGPSIATALLSVFYGVLMATLVAWPLSAKLRLRSRHEAAMKRMVVDGLLAVQLGESPLLVESRMTAWLRESQRPALNAARQSG